MDNTLLVSKTLDFPQLMKIAEGMSYRHSKVVIKARGKQIQRAVEVAIMLQERQRGEISTTEYSKEEGDVYIPTICINITV
jgi:DNA-binding protein Alba